MSDERYIGFHWYWIEEWSQFLGGCNWYTFHPIQIEIEDERSMGGIEATVIVLGLGFRVRWNYAETDKLDELKKLLAEALQEHSTTPPETTGAS